jgi:hypothetical protein
MYDTIDVRTTQQFPVENEIWLAIGSRLMVGPKVLRAAVQFGARIQTGTTHFDQRIGVIPYGIVISYTCCPDHISAFSFYSHRFRNIQAFGLAYPANSRASVMPVC